jgi:hypothetical protein
MCRVGELRIVGNIYEGEPEGKRLHRRPRRRGKITL